MYNDYFSFHRTPFSIAPDPDFLYLSEKHRDALAHLVYGLQTDGGFVLLTGEVGTGKTTLLRSLLNQVPDNLDIAFILNPKLTVKELLETLCEELGIPINRDEILGVKQYIDRLNRQLLKTHAMGRSTVLIIDEAQNLSPAVLEQVRLLTNLETNEKKLLRIILIGQPELGEILHREDLRQLAQRITARFHLSALDADDTYEYICHRLRKSGGSPNTFSKRATRRVHRLAKGIPRLINIISDRALLGAYVEASHQVTARIVSNAAKEVKGPSRQLLGKSVTAMLLVGILAALWYLQLPDSGASTHLVEPSANREPSAPLDIEPSANREPSAKPLASRKQEPSASKEPSAVQETETSIGAGETTLPGIESLTAAPPLPQTNTLAIADSPADSGQQISTTSSFVSGLSPASSTIERPKNVSRFQLHREAFAVLFDHWNLPIGDTPEIPCNFAPSVGLQCLRRSAEWTDIVSLNRPFMIELIDSDQELFYTAITELSAEQLVYEMDGRRWQAPAHLPPENWNGFYILLWQMPPNYRGVIQQGSEGPAVGFLRHNLAYLLQRDIPQNAAGDVFDLPLKTALVDFQRQNQLRPDGAAGALTWIILNTQIRASVPFLGGID